MLQLIGVPAAHAAGAWEDARPFVERALEEGLGHLAAEDVLAAIEARDMQLWLLVEPGAARLRGAVVTQLVDWPRRRVCRLVLAGAEDGRRSDWLGAIATIEAWALQRGCGVIELYGRPGWARLLPQSRRRVLLEWPLGAGGGNGKAEGEKA
jgi:hypothetical protein